MKIADLFVKLGLKDRDFKRGIDGAEKRTNKFSAAMKRVGGMIAGVFAVGQIVSFTKELMQLSGVAEGVRSAFKRIADDRILRDLQKATAGTVSELELMKRTVMASNFNIPVEQLASLFKFATKRAQETGESVDYLVNSIVIGIGRKSPLILDNLGISAIDLRRKLEGVGHAGATVGQVAKAVGEIAEEAMSKSGDIIDTNAIKLERLNAKWENFKKDLATSPGFNESVSRELTELSDNMEVMFSKNLTKYQKFLAFTDVTGKNMAILAKRSREATKAQNEYTDALNDIAASNRAALDLNKKSTEGEEERVKTIGELREEIDALKDSIDSYGVTQGAAIQRTLREIDVAEKLIKKLTTLKQTRNEVTAPPTMTGQAGTPQIAGEAPMPGGLADMSGFFERNAEKTKQYMDEMLSDWNSFGNQLSDTIESGAVDAISEFSRLIGELFSGSLNGESFFNRILGQLGRFLSALGKMIIAYGIAMEAFQTSLKNIFSGVGALGVIAAGAALVAIGGGIASYASRAASGGGTSGGGASVNFGIFSSRDGTEYQQGTQSQTFLKGTDIHINQSRVDTQQSLIG